MRTCFLYLFVAAICVGCSKGGAVEEPPHVIIINDDTYPVLEVATPTANQVFSSGSTINITGKVSDNSLYQGTITIRNDASGAIVKEQYYEIHYIPEYNFNLSHAVSVSTPTDFTVIVKFEDHGHNQTSKTVQVKVNP